MRAVVFVLFLLSTEAILASNRISALAPLMSHAKHALETPDVAGDQGTVQLLEVEQSPDRVVATTSCLEDVILGKNGVHWRFALARMSWLFIAVATMVVISVIISIIGTFYENGIGFHFNKGGIGYLFPWCVIASYMVLFSLELFYVNNIVSRGVSTLSSASKLIRFGKIEELAQSLLAITALNIPMAKLLEHSMTLTDSPRDYMPPALCTAAFDLNNGTFNEYPSGSAVYAYNLRRIATPSDANNPELDYVKALLLSNPYPPPAGGITREEGAPLRLLSNACERFNGNITKCCSDDNKDQWKAECPGQILQSDYSENHCSCVAGMAKLGLAVESQALSLCLVSIRDLMGDFLMTLVKSSNSAWTAPDLNPK